MSRKKQRGEDFKREDILQAVVICDSFNVRFAPLTENLPRALLPLVNVPLLDYTLEFLCAAGIQEVILFCTNNASVIKNHLSESKWLSPTSPMDVETIASEDCMSMGDALRDIDAKSLIHSDFILVNADVVANVKLRPLIEAHKQRRLKEKSAIMTLVMKHAPPRHFTRCKEDEVALTIKPDNARILGFKKMNTIKKFNVPLELFKEHRNLQVRHDLLDCQIAICSPHVPQLFTDNFDYLTREDFIKGILENEEILGNTIHLHVLEDEYAARVTNQNMYDAVSRDLLSRWCFPVVPDGNITDKAEDAYSYGLHNTYRHRDVTLARGCVLQQNVIIGQGTSIGSNTNIKNSVIGKYCSIGENVHLDGAYIWDGVIVRDNCSVTSSILSNDVQLKSGVTIQLGCLLAEKVIVGPSITLKQGTLLSATSSNDFGEEEEVDHSVVGSAGHGYLYHHHNADSDSDSDADDADDPLVQEVLGLRLDSEEDEALTASSGSDSEDDDDDMAYEPPPDEFKMFSEEVIGTLERAVAENIGLDNMVLEINSLKHGYGIQIKEVNLLVTRAILELPFKSNEDLEPAEYLSSLVQNFKKMMPVLKNYIRSEASQKDCLASIESLCLANSTVLSVLVKLLHYLYNADVLSEEAIIAWYNQGPDPENKQPTKALRKQVEGFITWLEEAEEEDSDEEDDD